MNNINIYVIFHKYFPFIHSDLFVPISPKTEYNLNILTADTNNNISCDNEYFAEYTTFYWVWKNLVNDNYLGFFHYRRYLCFEKEVDLSRGLKWDRETLSKLLKNYDLLIPPKTYLNETLYQQYTANHDENLLIKAIEYISDNYNGKYDDSMVSALNKDYAYFCNLFVCKREIFNDYMEFVYPILSELKKYLNEKSQLKALAYLGERLFCIYVEYLIKNSTYKICEVPLLFIVNENGGCILYDKVDDIN